ncbi:MAG: flagellar hook-associated protein FlgK [Desulfosporosinus sp.]|nr:flagellar hook-associated protein FlgK [Desulfosporosinus sp.]
MSSTFFGFELSRRALNAQQTALNITGQNIANANTPGYTRQIGNLTATTPETISVSGGTMSVGTGVTLDTITRARDAMVDNQFRTETSKQQYYGTKQSNLTNVEGIMNEPSDSSLSGVLNSFWTSWSDLSNNPTDSGTRSVVVQRAKTLTDGLHSISAQISDLQNNIESNVKTQIPLINNYASQIKDLNGQIKQAEASGDQPNDLYDSRDNVVDQLAKLVNVKVTETPDSSFSSGKVSNYKIEIGDPPQTLVDGGAVNQLVGVTQATGLGGSATTAGNEITTVQWANGTPLKFGQDGGALQANIETRDTDLTTLQGKYDDLATGIVTAVNDIYGSGTGAGAGAEFFDNSSPVTASNISVSTSTATDNIIGTGSSGDGSIAAAISSLSSGWSNLTDTATNSDLTDMKTKYGTSLGDFYGATVTQLGADVQQATSQKSAEDALVTNATNQRESTSGVSLDEEMTNLLQFQKSYAAAARMVTMMDDMLSTLMNMGLTK